MRYVDAVRAAGLPAEGVDRVGQAQDLREQAADVVVDDFGELLEAP